MVYCLQAQLAFNTATRRNNVRTAILNRIDGRSRWQADRIEAQSNRIGPNGLAVELRFVSRADQEDLESRLDALFPQNPPLAGSWMRLHDCSHDEATNACSVTSTREW